MLKAAKRITDEINKVFNSYYRKYDYWYEKYPFAFLSEVEALKRIMPSGKGLEIGVGTGRFAQALSIEAGIDPSRKMREVARRRGVTVYEGSGEQLSFDRETFDYVAIIIALCFVADPQETLRETYRVLKPRGTVIIAIIDKESFLGRSYQEKKSVFYKKARFFTVPEVSDLLRSEGFDELSFHQTIFSPPQDMSDIDLPKEGYGEGGFVVISARKKGNNVTKGEQ